MKPEFILVTGANATGKTTLIEKNRALLETAGFQIIIPDILLKYATSMTDVSAVIMELVNEALSLKSSFVLETPFQFEDVVETLDEIKEAGYGMSMYQLFAKDVAESADRVQQRHKVGGLFINSDEVKSNFSANLKNVAANFDRFDHSYFIDNSSKKAMKLAAEFNNGKLIQLRVSEYSYLKKLFQRSALMNKISQDTLQHIQANKIYPSLLPKHTSIRNRLKL